MDRPCAQGVYEYLASLVVIRGDQLTSVTIHIVSEEEGLKNPI